MIRPSLTKASFHSGSPLSRLLLSVVTLLPITFWASAAPASAQEAVSWTQAWGTSVSGSSLMKIGPAGWNAAAVSTKSIVAGSGSLEFTAGPAANVVCGLTSRPSLLGYESIDFALRLDATGNVVVLESGAASSTAAPFTPGDRFRIAVDADAVRFSQNGLPLYASTKAPSYPLSAIASLDTPGVTISAAALSGTLLENVLWTNGVNVTSAGSDLRKSAGAAAWDAGAVSTRGIVSMDGYLELVASETTTSRMIGLSQGDTSQTYQDIDFALYLAGQTIYVYERGASRGSFGTYVTGDRLRVSVEGGAIRYRKNGVLLYESTVAPSFPLLVDSSLYTRGATLRGAVLSGELVDVALASPVFSLPTGHYATAQTVVVTSPDPLATIHYTTTGADPTEADAVIGSGESILVEQDTVLKARAWRSGLIPSGVTTATYTFGPIATEPVVWTNGVNVTVAGSDLTKSGTAAAWDAGAASTRAIVSMDGYLELVASETTTSRMIGLSQGDTNPTYQDIDFAIYLAGSSVYVYEAGASRGAFGSYVAGDRLRVAVENGAIRYRKNGVLLYESTVAPSFPLLVDSSLYTRGATLKGAVISGELEDTILAAPVFSPTGGVYSSPLDVAITATPGATIRYTTDGSDPTEVSSVYSTPIRVEAPIVLKARAWKPNYFLSAVSTAAFEMQVAAPVITPPGGLFMTAITVEITSTPGAEIHYTTTEGGDPTEASDVYTGPLTINTATHLRARAFKSGWAASPVSDALYQFNCGTLEPPVLSPAAGIYETSVQVSITGSPGADTFYTTDGTAPTTTSERYASPFTLTASTTVRAVSYKLDWTPSSVAEASYSVKVAAPIVSPAGGVYSGVKRVRVTSTTPGAVIHYTMNGGEPAETDPVIGATGTVLVATTGTFRARGFKSDLVASETTVADFTFERRGVVAGGGEHSLVVKPDGTVWAWGLNGSGQLGDDTQTSRTLPVQVQRVSDIIAAAAGSGHSLALTSGGHVWSWGEPGYGQLGNGSTTASASVRYEVQEESGRALDNVVAIAAGGHHSLALKADGTVWVWGWNVYGQLGDGTTTLHTRATVIRDIQGAAAIAAGLYHSLAANGTDGTVWAWGYNYTGGLGDGTNTSPRLLPVAVDGLTGTMALQGGFSHSVALGLDGLAWACGGNNYNQLGDGTSQDRWAPVRVVDLEGASLIAAGWNHGLALADGEVWAWGSNYWGQLGDGTTVQYRNRVVKLPTLSNVVTLGAGANHSLAIDGEGTVWAWGQNYFGQLGDGTTLDRASPVRVSGPGFAWRVGTPVMSVAPGTYSAPLTVTLTSATSGASIYYSPPGDDPTTLYTGPVSVAVTTLLKARATKLGQPDSNVSSALYTLKLATPSFNPWGGTFYPPPTPTVEISACAPTPCTTLYSTDGSEPSIPYTDAVAISTTTTLQAKAVKTDWSNSDTTSATYTLNLGTLAPPTLAPAGGTFLGSQDVEMGSITGATIHYTLGDGTNPDPTTSSPTYSSPITLTVTTTVKAKAFHRDWVTSPTATAIYTIKVAEPPTISLTSGQYPIGQAVTVTSADTGTTIVYTLDGSAPTTSSPSVPSGTTLYLMKALTLKAAAFRTGCSLSDVATADYTVTGTVPIVTVSGGGQHSLLAKPDGAVWAWGYNNYGQLGDATYSQRLTPVPLASPTSIGRLDAGANHSTAVKSDGTIWAWGYNYYGQLGDGTTTTCPTPVQLGFATDLIVASAGGEHSLAVRAGGSVWAWGRNNVGQLGIGSTTPAQSASPLQIPSLGDVVSVSAGTAHSLAVKSDATAWAWGSNGYGQLGDNSTTQQNAPVQVSGLTGVVAVAAGELHSLALKNDGTVWAWGYGGLGQLGDGTSSNRTTPVRVAGLTGAVAVASGAHHSFAVLLDGTLWAWGYNGYGQVGDGTTTNRPKPVQISIPGAVIAVGAGTSHSLAVTLDGAVWAWGYNYYGQLGLGTTVSPRLTPTRVSADGYAWRVAVPTFDVASGSYDTEKTVHPSSVTPGATICYTTDGTSPSGCQLSVPSGGSIQVTQSLTLRVIATKMGMSPSEEDQAAYTLILPAPSFLPGPGIKYTDLTVTLTPPAGATIRYTTDGTYPTETTGTAYAAPVPVTRTQTVYARAFKAGWTQSNVAGGGYTMTVADPTLSPGGGSYSASQTVSLTQTTTPNAPIHYTIDGREPTAADPVGTSVVVDRSMTVRAKCFRDGWTSSATVVGAYFLTVGSATAPTMDPPAGSYGVPQLVVLRSATPGAKIRYTTDGSEPTLFSRSYLSPILVDETVTLKAKAFAGDKAPSSTATGTYTIAVAQVATPRFSPASGPFTTARSVTVTCSTPGVLIYYTTDGTDPDQSDQSITSGQTVNVDRSMTLKATAWLDSTPSAVREGNYHITGAVSAGGTWGGPFHSLTLRSDGHVWSWGHNNYGQLGDGTTTVRPAPVEVQASDDVPLSGVVAVEAGSSYSLAITTDGHVWAWGYNYYGQLGSGSTTNAPVVFPVEVKRESASGPALDGIVALAAGLYHTVALKSDGTVWAWGYDQGYGALGDGTAGTIKPYAVSVLTESDNQPLDDVVAIATSHAHCLALRSDGSVWGWGYGQGVDGSTSVLTRAVQVSGLNGFVGVAAGVNLSATVRVDGTVWAWGENSQGQLGHGSTIASVRPERAANLTRAAQVDVGPNGQHVVALVPGAAGEQTVWAWGSARYGQMGDSSTAPLVDRLSPAQVPHMVDVVATSAGASHTVALIGDGTVWTWGYPWAAGLGRDTLYPSLASTPSPVPDFTLADTSWVTADPDGDGLPTGFEWRLGTDALKADTNGDGVSDGAAVNNGVSTTDPDTDGDGVRNVVEVAQGTDPLRADTDSDGVGDGQDCYPLDPSRWQCPQPVPGDTTPPLILLTEPTNAIIISSLP
jgi:alpha-tubulin suppressor-like RCC1 family protein